MAQNTRQIVYKNGIDAFEKQKYARNFKMQNFKNDVKNSSKRSASQL